MLFRSHVLNYSTGVMIYGAKRLDATQGLRIDDPVYATNLNEHFKQCVFYDVLLGRKTYDDILKSSDLLTAMGPGSVALSQQYIYSDGTSGIITGQTAYTFISGGWNSDSAVVAPNVAAQFFPGIPPPQAPARLKTYIKGTGAQGGATSQRDKER